MSGPLLGFYPKGFGRGPGADPDLGAGSIAQARSTERAKHQEKNQRTSCVIWVGKSQECKERYHLHRVKVTLK